MTTIAYNSKYLKHIYIKTIIIKVYNIIKKILSVSFSYYGHFIWDASLTRNKNRSKQTLTAKYVSYMRKNE